MEPSGHHPVQRDSKDSAVRGDNHAAKPLSGPARLLRAGLAGTGHPVHDTQQRQPSAYSRSDAAASWRRGGAAPAANDHHEALAPQHQTLTAPRDSKTPSSTPPLAGRITATTATHSNGSQQPGKPQRAPLYITAPRTEATIGAPPAPLSQRSERASGTSMQSRRAADMLMPSRPIDSNNTPTHDSPPPHAPPSSLGHSTPPHVPDLTFLSQGTRSSSGGSAGRFSLAQSEQTRLLKDSARMSHMATFKPRPHSSGSDSRPYGSTGQRYSHSSSPSQPATGYTADGVALAQVRLDSWVPAAGGPNRDVRRDASVRSGLPGAKDQFGQQPRSQGRSPSTDSGADSNKGEGLDAQIAAMFAKAGNNLPAILDIIQLQMDTGPLGAAGLAGAIHRLGAACQNSEGGRGHGRDNPRTVVLESRTFHELRAQTVANISAFSARNLANMLWGLARLDHAPPELMAAACQQVVLRVDQANPQNVGNTLWALGALAYHPGNECLRALIDRAIQLREDLLPQHISNILLSLAKLEHNPGSHVMQMLVDEACNKLHEFAPQALANSLWACARLGCAHQGIMDGVWQAVTDPMTPVWRQLNAQNWGNLAWAYATLGYLPAPDMLEQVCSGMLPLMDRAAPQNLTNLAWALAKLQGAASKHTHTAGATTTGLLPSTPPVSTGRLDTMQGSVQGVAGKLGLSKGKAGDYVGFSTGSMAGAYDLELGSSGAVTLPKALLEAEEDVVCGVISSPRLRGSGATLGAAAGAAPVSGLGSLPPSASKVPATGRASPCGSMGGATRLPPGSRSEQYMTALTRLASRMMPSWQSQAISNLTWSCAVLGVRPEQAYLQAVVQRMSGTISQWPIQHISNTLWALATMGHKDTALLSTVAGHLVSRFRLNPDCLDAFKPQHVSNILWAYGTLEVPAPELCNLLFKSLVGRLPAFTCQEISNSCWATARLAHYDFATLDAVAEHVTGSRVHQLLPQHMSNLAWAYGRLTHAHQGLMVGLAKTAKYQIKSLSCQHLSNMICAYGMLALEHPLIEEFVAACRKEVLIRCGVTRLGSGSSSNSSGGSTSARSGAPGGSIGHSSGGSVASRERGSAGGGSSGAGSEPLRSWGSVGERELTSAVGTLAPGDAMFIPQQVTNVIWGLTLLGASDLTVWSALMGLLRNQLSQRAEDLPEEALTQLFQAYLLLCLQGVPPEDLIRTALPGSVELAEQCWRESVANPLISAMHKEVSNTLLTMGIRHVNEQITQDGYFSVDVAVTELPTTFVAAAAGVTLDPTSQTLDAITLTRPLAIEVDGPSHFAANTLCQPLGVTVARRQCLAARGWQVVSVPHTLWSAARAPAERTVVLTELITQALVASA